MPLQGALRPSCHLLPAGCMPGHQAAVVCKGCYVGTVVGQLCKPLPLPCPSCTSWTVTLIFSEAGLHPQPAVLPACSQCGSQQKKFKSQLIRGQNVCSQVDFVTLDFVLMPSGSWEMVTGQAPAG